MKTDLNIYYDFLNGLLTNKVSVIWYEHEYSTKKVIHGYITKIKRCNSGYNQVVIADKYNIKNVAFFMVDPEMCKHLIEKGSFGYKRKHISQTTYRFTIKK